MKRSHIAYLFGILLAGSAALASSTPQYITDPSQCKQNTTSAAANSKCQSCLQSSTQVWVEGSGCESIPNGATVTTASNCARVSNTPLSTAQADCNCCLSKGSSYTVGSGCTSGLASGTVVTQTSQCSLVSGCSSASTCQSCIQGGSEYIVGTGCGNPANMSILPKGWVIYPKNVSQCKKIQSPTVGINCQTCLKTATNTWTIGSGCSS